MGFLEQDVAAALIPIGRQRSFMGARASASFNTPTICS